MEHDLNNKPDVASYRCETESSRAKKAPLKEKSGGTPVAKPKLVPMKKGSTKKPTQPRVPSTPASARQRKGGRNSAREPTSRSTRKSTFDLPMISRSLWTPKQPVKILKRPSKAPEMPSQVGETAASEPPTIAPAQDISNIVRKANTSLHPEAPPFVPNAQQLHTPEGPPSRPDLASHAAINNTRSRPGWGAGSSSSSPLNRTGFHSASGWW
jgi:hypothetical protein